MKHILLITCAAVILFAPLQAAFAGLGKPLPTRTPEESLRDFKSTEAYRQALRALEAKGYSKEQADAALAKLPQEHISLLGAQAVDTKAGGDLVGFLLFVLFVMLVVYLIILLVDASSYRRYGY